MVSMCEVEVALQENRQILTEGNKTFKNRALTTLKGNWAEAIVVCFCSSFLKEVVPIYLGVESLNNVIGYLSYVILISTPISLGLFKFFLDTYRKDSKLSALFYGFRIFFKSVAVRVLYFALIVLGTALFIVPGIIFLIRYSQAFFILLDNPSYSVRRCFTESRKFMEGNEFNYFSLLISFIGWYVLIALVTIAVPAIFKSIYITDYVTLSLIVIILLAPVVAYFLTTMAAFYEAVRGVPFDKDEYLVRDPAFDEE